MTGLELDSVVINRGVSPMLSQAESPRGVGRETVT